MAYRLKHQKNVDARGKEIGIWVQADDSNEPPRKIGRLVLHINKEG